jgi:hypothetical protein
MADVLCTTSTPTTNQINTAGGPIGATIDFAVAGANLLSITITNTEVGQQMSLGQEVSSLIFTINGLSVPTSFQTLSGTELDLTGASHGSS